MSDVFVLIYSEPELDLVLGAYDSFKKARSQARKSAYYQARDYIEGCEESGRMVNYRSVCKVLLEEMSGYAVFRTPLNHVTASEPKFIWEDK